MYEIYMKVAMAVMNEEQQHDINSLVLQGYTKLAQYLLLDRIDRSLICNGITFHEAAEYYNMLDVPRERVFNFPQKQSAC